MLQTAFQIAVDLWRYTDNKDINYIYKMHFGYLLTF